MEKNSHCDEECRNECNEHNESELENQISIILSKSNPEEAVLSMTNPEKQNFLLSYYDEETIDYETTKKKLLEESETYLAEALKNGTNYPYSEELVDFMIDVCKLNIIDKVLDKMEPVYKNLRKNLENHEVGDFKSTMMFQMASGSLSLEYNKLLSEELIKRCEKEKINIDMFMQYAFMKLADFSVILELDNFYGLRIFKSLKEKEVKQETVLAYINKTIEYSNMILENKLNPQTVIIFPNMVNHLLYNEFKTENVQVLDWVINFLHNNQINEENQSIFDLLIKDVYFIEKSKIIIQKTFQQQMMRMQSMFQDPQGFNDMMKMMPQPGLNLESNKQGLSLNMENKEPMINNQGGLGNAQTDMPDVSEILGIPKINQMGENKSLQGMGMPGMPGMDMGGFGPGMGMPGMPGMDMGGFGPGMGMPGMPGMDMGGFGPGMGMPGMPGMDMGGFGQGMGMPGMDMGGFGPGMDIGQMEEMAKAMENMDLSKLVEFMPPEMKQMLEMMQKKQQQ